MRIFSKQVEEGFPNKLRFSKQVEETTAHSCGVKQMLPWWGPINTAHSCGMGYSSSFPPYLAPVSRPETKYPIPGPRPENPDWKSRCCNTHRIKLGRFLIKMKKLHRIRVQPISRTSRECCQASYSWESLPEVRKVGKFSKRTRKITKENI